MQKHIIQTDLCPPPWGDSPADWPVLTKPVRTWTEEAISKIVCPASLQGHRLILPDNLLISPEFLAAFFARATQIATKGVLQAYLGPGTSASRSAGRSGLPPSEGGLPLPLLLIPEAQDNLPQTLDDLRAACAETSAVLVDPQDRAQSIPVPRAYADEGEDSIEVTASTRVALWMTHRSHLQQANLELLGATFLRSMGRPKFLLALRYLYERWRPGARRLFSTIGARSRIHPTAIVEASSLGADCEIGAYAIVRGSVLGDGAVVEDGAHVQMSCLGPTARVARQTSVFASVLMEGAHSAQAVMQMSVLGRHSATTSASWFVDVRLGGNVRVEGPDDSLLDGGTRFLGCDMGHNSFLGAGVTVASGRMLPSNAKIIADPRATLSKLGSADALDGGDQIFVVLDGQLEALR